MPEVAAAAERHEKYERLIEAARASDLPLAHRGRHPCDGLRSKAQSRRQGSACIQPVLVAPPARLREVAARRHLDISGFEVVEAAHSHDSADKAVELVRSGGPKP